MENLPALEVRQEKLLSSDGEIMPESLSELKALLWNRDLTKSMKGIELFILFESNARHLDCDALTKAEITLLKDLTTIHGGGVSLSKNRAINRLIEANF